MGRTRRRVEIEPKRNDRELATVENKDAPSLDTKEGQVALLETLFRHRYPDLPYNSFSNLPTEAIHNAMDIKLQELYTDFQDKPSLVHWLRCGLFDGNFISLALLFIELYEKHPENIECNFREIYRFLYKLTMNKTPSSLSHNSAKVLYDLIVEILNEVWPDAQKDFLKYFCNVYQYSRPMIRRTYPGKKALSNRSTV